MAWKKDRICHQVLCPLLGLWRIAKKGVAANEDLSEKERVFDTFFGSVCPRHIE